MLCTNLFLRGVEKQEGGETKGREGRKEKDWERRKEGDAEEGKARKGLEKESEER